MKKTKKTQTHELPVTKEFPEKFPNENWEIEVSKTDVSRENLQSIVDDLIKKNTKVALVRFDAGYVIFRKWEQKDTDMGILSRLKDRKPVRGCLVETWGE